ncbi:hypothetical protein FRX31_030014, partial [Thalictrum thalictroides]
LGFNLFSTTQGSFQREDCVTGDNETRDSFSDTCSDETESQNSWRWEGGSYESTPYRRVPLMDKV